MERLDADGVDRHQASALKLQRSSPPITFPPLDPSGDGDGILAATQKFLGPLGPFHRESSDG